MDRILFLGDSHGDSTFVGKAITTAKDLGCDAVVQVGDFGFWPQWRDGPGFLKFISNNAKQAGIPVYWLAGNHEDWDTLDAMVADNGGGIFEHYPHLFHISTGHTWSWGNTNFGCLAGAFSIDWKRRVKGRSWYPQEMPRKELIDGLGKKLDILLTHDAPIPPPIVGHNFKRDPQSVASQTVIANAIAHCAPEWVIHGHWHVRNRYQFGVHGTIVDGLDCNYASIHESALIVDINERIVYSINEAMYGGDGEHY